jgi:8-hydroxy-5-deazaflavin:NADPH oxidoreductase
MGSITLIGSGNMARGIGSRAVAAGYDVQVLDRDPAKARALTDDLKGATAGALTEAPTGDIVVLALPYGAAEEVISQIGSQLDGKTVVDITNPVNFETFAGLVTPADSSAAQEIAKLVPSAHVVKAFNTTFAATLADGSVAEQQLDVLIAGDDQGAKDAVAQFVEAAGMRPLDVGPLAQAHWLEGVGLLHMGLQVSKGWGWNTGVKLIGA